MKYNRNEAYEILNDFTAICKKHKIWYSVAENMMLGVQRHGGFVPWFEKMQVMMTPESYRKLLRLYPNKVIDSSIISNYKSLKAAFVVSSAQWDVHMPFIEIIMVIPTTLKKVKRFKSIARNIMHAMLFRKNTIRNAIDDLYEQNNEGYIQLISRSENVMKNWIPNISFETKTRRFGIIDVEMMVEYDKILQRRFGDDYMKAIVPNKDFIFPNPKIKIKEKL